MLIPGDEAELELTFLGDTEYRVAVCAHPVLNDVEFNVLNQENILLWSNSDGSDHLDFRMEMHNDFVSVSCSGDRRRHPA